MNGSINNDTAVFHVQLLTKTLDMEKYPLTKLIIEKKLSNKEYEELFQLLQTINSNYEIQQEEGLLDYTSLLIHFAGMLNDKLKPRETVYALYKEGYFTDLMKTFIRIMEKYDIE